MQILLTEAEYNELLHYKNEYKKPDSIGQKHIELLVKYNELMSQHLALKNDYNKLLVFGVSASSERLKATSHISYSSKQNNKKKGE